MATDTLPMLAAVLAFFAVAGLVLAVAATFEAHFGRRARGLQRQIERMRQQSLPTMAAQLARRMEMRWPIMLQGLQQTAPLRAMALLLLRAGSPMQMSSLLGLMGVVGGVTVMAGLALQVGVSLTLAAPLIAMAAPLLWLWWLGAQRRARFEAQFPDALDFIARSLRAGHGLMAGVGMIAKELPEPVSREFGTVFDETQFGMSPAEPLARMATRIDSRDLDFFVVAVAIQRETGGNLAELLAGLASTVRERIKLAGKVRALSAEGRLSGVLMTLLPFVLGVILTALNPEYMSLLWTTPEGRQTVVIMLVMMLVGSFWIQLLVRIKV